MSLVLTGDPSHITTQLTATVIGLANNGSGAVRAQTSAPHLFGPADEVAIRTTTLSGLFSIAVIDATHFDLVGSTYTATGTGSATDLSLTPQVLVPTDGDTFSQQLSGALSSAQAALDRTQYLQGQIRTHSGNSDAAVASIVAQNWCPEFQFTTGIVQHWLAWDPLNTEWMLLYEDGGGIEHLQVTSGLDEGTAAAWTEIKSGGFSPSTASSYGACCSDPGLADHYWACVSGATAGSNVFELWHGTSASWTDAPGGWTSVVATGTFYGVAMVKLGAYVIAAVSGSSAGDSFIVASNNGFSTWVSAASAGGGSVTIPPCNSGVWYMKSNGAQVVALQGLGSADMGVYVSNDGHSWTLTQNLATIAPAGGNVHGLAWSADAQGPCWIVAVATVTAYMVFFRSADGINWAACAGGIVSQQDVSDMAAVVPGTRAALVCTLGDVSSGGSSGTIWSVDGAQTWYEGQAYFTSNVTTLGARSRVTESPTGLMMANGKYIRFSELAGLPSRSL